MRVTASPLVAVILLAAACTGGGSADHQTATADLTSAATPGISTRDANAQVGLYLQHHGHVDGFPQLGGQVGDSALFAIDAITGLPLIQEPPIKLGRSARGLVASPDGTTIAMVVGGDDGFPRVQLLETGPNRDAENTSADPILWPSETGAGGAFQIDHLTWSRDGKHLYWLRWGFSPTTDSWEREIWTLDVIARQAQPLASLEGDSLGALMISPDGHTLYLLRYSCCGALGTIGSELVAVDSSIGTEMDRLRLPSLGAESTAGPADLAAVLSPDGAHIYVVHADVDAVTTLTTEPLTAGTTTFLDVDEAAARSGVEKRSLAARIGGWMLTHLVTRAEAKQPSFTLKTAQISPDGHLLYISGSSSEACPDDPHRACVWDDPLGLQIVDLDSMQLVDHQAGIAEFALSADGRWIAGHGAVSRWSNDQQQTTEEGFGLTLIDAHSGDVVASFAPGTVIEQIAFDRTSQHLYYTITGEPGCDSCVLLTTVDLKRPTQSTTVPRGPRPVTLVSLH
jgi:hypothetical protein